MSFGARSFVFTFGLGGGDTYQRKIPGVMERLDDMSPALEEIGVVLRQHLYEVFITEGKANDQEWAPLNDKYAAWKAKHYPGQTKLTLDGQLARALVFRGAPGNITEISGREAVFGASRRTPDGKWDLGLIHHHGSPKRRIPARPIIKLPPKIKSRFTRILREFLNREA